MRITTKLNVIYQYWEPLLSNEQEKKHNINEYPDMMTFWSIEQFFRVRLLSSTLLEIANILAVVNIVNAFVILLLSSFCWLDAA